MLGTSKIFKALPNVKSIWLTEDGNFHLNAANGGKQVNRGGETPDEDTDGLLEKYGAIPKPAEDVIKAIEAAKSEEEVNYFLGKDKRKTVIDAAEAKKVSL